MGGFLRCKANRAERWLQCRIHAGEVKFHCGEGSQAARQVLMSAEIGKVKASTDFGGYPDLRKKGTKRHNVYDCGV